MPLAGIEPARGMKGTFAWFPKVRLFGCPMIRAGSDRLKDAAAPPILPSVMSALARAGLSSTLDKIGSSAPRFAAPSASLTRPDPVRAPVPVFKTEGGDDDRALRPHPGTAGRVARLHHDASRTRGGRGRAHS